MDVHHHQHQHHMISLILTVGFTKYSFKFILTKRQQTSSHFGFILVPNKFFKNSQIKEISRSQKYGNILPAFLERKSIRSILACYKNYIRMVHSDNSPSGVVPMDHFGKLEIPNFNRSKSPIFKISGIFVVKLGARSLTNV